MFPPGGAAGGKVLSTRAGGSWPEVEHVALRFQGRLSGDHREKGSLRPDLQSRAASRRLGGTVYQLWSMGLAISTRPLRKGCPCGAKSAH